MIAAIKPLFRTLSVVITLAVVAVLLFLIAAPKRYEVYVSPFAAGPGLRGINLSVKTPCIVMGPCGFGTYSNEIFSVRYQPAGVEQGFVDATIERFGDPASGPMSGKVRIATSNGADPRLLRVEVTSSDRGARQLTHDYIITNEIPVAPHSWAKVGE